MSLRSPLIALVILLLVPATGHAADPLLSGYAGPGGGEQVVLGGGTVGGGGGTSGGASASGDESLRATPSTTSSSGSAGKLTSTPQRRKDSSSSSSDTKTMPSGSSSASTPSKSTAAPAPAGAPPVVAYPTRAGEVSGLPVSAAGVLLLVLAVALFVLAGLGLRRLCAGSDDSPPRPQVSAT